MFHWSSSTLSHLAGGIGMETMKYHLVKQKPPRKTALLNGKSSTSEYVPRPCSMTKGYFFLGCLLSLAAQTRHLQPVNMRLPPQEKKPIVNRTCSTFIVCVLWFYFIWHYSIYLSICLSIYLSIDLSIHLSIYPFIHLSISHLSISLSY